MIFVSIALLVAAAIALGIGIASSSIFPLVVSVGLTLAAAATLWGSFVRYRSEAAAGGLAVTGLGGNQPRRPGYPGAYGAAPVDGTGHPTAPPAPNGRHDPTPAGWDELEEIEAVEAVEAFNLDELHELRRHEVEHAHRGPVLGRIDERIESLVAIRRRLART